MFFGSTAVLSFIIIIAIFSVSYLILPQKHNWIAFLIMTILFSYMAYHIVPNPTDDLFRYYNAINDLRINGWDKLKEFVEIDNCDMKNYISVRYLFWLVSRTKNNQWLQTIVISFTYGSQSIMILLAQKRFHICKSYVFFGSLFMFSTYWYYDCASGVRNAFCFAIIVFCSYILFVEKKFIPLCIVGYIIAFYMHSSGLLAIALVILTVILNKIESVFVNFVFMFSLIGGNFVVQSLAENSNNSLLLSIAGRAERHVGGESLSTETNFFVNEVTVVLVIVLVIYFSYYLKGYKYSNTSLFYKYVSLTMYFVAGSVFSGMIFMRFTRWVVPVLAGLIIMIGLQKNNDAVSEKGENYYKYYAIPLERFIYKIKPLILIIIIIYSIVHLWYDYSGSSLTFSRFIYQTDFETINDLEW